MISKRLYIGIAVLLVSAAAYVGCSDGPSKPIVPTNGDSFDEVVTLGVGETVVFTEQGLKIGFERVTDDSRCPLNAYCFWAGMARVRLWLLEANGDTAIATPAILGTSPPLETIRSLSVTVLGYRVSLLELNPYPPDFNSIDPSEYVATVEMEALNGDRYVPEVTITDLPPDSILLDPYSVDTLRIHGDVLAVGVQYGGGCTDHDFIMCMSPAVFLESYPVQANLYLRHDSHGDMCEALVSEVLEFDLSPVASLFHSQYPGSAGVVRLNVHEFDGDDYTSYRRILYVFQ